MKRFTSLFILTFLDGSTFAQTPSFNYAKDFAQILKQTKDPASNLYYNKLLKRFKTNDVNLTEHETLALLIGFTSDSHFKPYDYLDTERRIYSLNAQGKFNDALHLADSLLVTVPVSQQAIIEKSYALHKTGQPDSATFYLWKFRKIMTTMASTGDGLTPETAIFSLGPADGQNFIYKALASRIGTMGSGHDKNGNFLDILEALIKDEATGETKSQTMYFQIQHAVKRMFEPGEVEKAMKETKKGKKGKLKMDKNGRLYLKDK